MIEKTEVTRAKCLCGQIDYAPIEDEALLSLPGFKVVVIHQDMQEEGYACKTAHLGRTAKALGEKLGEDLNGNGEKSSGWRDETTGLISGPIDDDDTGLLAG